MRGRRGRRRKQLLNDLRKRRGYWNLKEQALDRTVWRNRFGRGYGLVVKQTTEWMILELLILSLYKPLLHIRIQFLVLTLVAAKINVMWDVRLHSLVYARALSFSFFFYLFSLSYSCFSSFSSPSCSIYSSSSSSSSLGARCVVQTAGRRTPQAPCGSRADQRIHHPHWLQMLTVRQCIRVTIVWQPAVAVAALWTWYLTFSQNVEF